MQQYFDISPYHKPITTPSSSCQTWTNRALMNLWGFNHCGAIECFQRALKEDSDCCFACWGIAYAYGPHYNGILVGEWEFGEGARWLALAKTKMANGANWEKDLIQVLELRFPKDFDQDHTKSMESALVKYSAQFKKIYQKYPQDIQIGCLYAESIMNLNPWKLWHKNGDPTKQALLAKQVLEKLLSKGYHPMASHLYLHLIELSPYSKQPFSLQVADQLYTNIRGIAHLKHMPSHLYIQVGDYLKSLQSNIKAVQADFQTKKYQTKTSFYQFYRAHNAHFAIWAAMFLGDYETAMKYSKIIKEIVDEETVKKIGEEAEFYVNAELHVMIRFGRWEDILGMEVEGREEYPLYRTTQRYSRTIAYAVLGKVEQAQKQFGLFQSERKLIKNRNYSNNCHQDIFNVGQAMAQGQLLYRKGQYQQAYSYLRKSVQLSDALVYDEPWGWMQPPRHALGALLLEQGHYGEAEAAYLEDLAQYPNNIWSLTGLDQIYEKQADEGKREGIRGALETARKNSKQQIKVSCFCKLK